jgi:catechol 2,3-dioxygenase-like lactoylglutathione lyase family enzyme
MNATAADFVQYTVSDLETSVAFYRDRLGLALESLHEDLGWAEFALPPTTLALYEPADDGPFSPGTGGVSVAFAVDDVEAAVEELREDGLTVPMEPIGTGVCDTAMVEDPDGNPIVLHRRHDGTRGRKNPFP